MEKITNFKSFYDKAMKCDSTIGMDSDISYHYIEINCEMRRNRITFNQHPNQRLATVNLLSKDFWLLDRNKTHQNEGRKCKSINFL
jgi:hypothetical protein